MSVPALLASSSATLTGFANDVTSRASGWVATLRRYTLPLGATPLGSGPYVVGSSGTSSPVAPVSVAVSASAAISIVTLACPSGVSNASDASLPLDLLTVPLPFTGDWLVSASGRGGLTQRDGAGGANPSYSGRAPPGSANRVSNSTTREPNAAAMPATRTPPGTTPPPPRGSRT